MGPIVGQMLHYYPDAESDYAGQGPIPAVVTKVMPIYGGPNHDASLWGYRVQLHPLHPGLPYHMNSQFGETPGPGRCCPMPLEVQPT